MSNGSAIAVAVATPVLSFLAVLLGQWVTRRSARELDVWRRREETMRLLRWAVESATSENQILAYAGLATLEELLDAELLQEADQPMVSAIAEMVLAATAAMAYGECPDDVYTGAPEVDVLEEVQCGE